MNKVLVVILVLIYSLGMAAEALSELHVFACEPEWGSLAREIGSHNIKVFTATSARQDPHYVRARPSLISAMRRADLVICSGASLEIGWLPLLVQKSGNPKIQQGGIGYLMAANYVKKLEIPQIIDRAQGDVHPEGNPHVHLNPHNVAIVAEELKRRFMAIDRNHSNSYQENFKEFDLKWEKAVANWEKRARNLKGLGVVEHHKSFTYLINWLGLKELGTLEVKPGIPPTSSHLEALLQLFRNSKPKYIIRTPYDPKEASVWLAEKIGAPALVLPFTVGGNKESKDLFGLFESTINLLEANAR